MQIEKTHGTIQGQYETVDIVMHDGIDDMGGFDLLIAYDASALSFTGAEPGPALYDPAPDGCGWEYFTYRSGAGGNCGDQCPSGLLRIIAIAETNNGANHPTCYGPPDGNPHNLARLKFFVTNDRTYECQYVPIQFYWGDCGDNSISSVGGTQLYIDHAVYDFEGLQLWDEDDDDEFPEDDRLPHIGAPDYCLNTDPEKPTAIRLIDFINGGIDIVCADSIDSRGDINLNEVPNEIADVTVFINYFVYGISAFTENEAGQVAATDVNADGIVLSVADLTYLIRIVLGDVAPMPKEAPPNAAVHLNNDVVSVDAAMGAAWIVVAGRTAPTLLADNMEMKYAYDDVENVTRVLIYSMEDGNSFTGDFLRIGGEIVNIEVATADGQTVSARLLPDNFALHQNHPNPFNPVTTISFAVPVATDYDLTIFNLLGQTVATFSGRAEPGIITVEWDATAYASGMYLYKLTAGNFTDTRKMILLK